MSRQSTLREVASLAQVSIKTASRVANCDPNVAAETRERVSAAIEQLGYRPNMFARVMRNKRSETFGLIVPSIRNTFYSAIARGIDDAARHHNRTVLVANADRDGEREREQIRLMLDRHVESIILASPVVGPECVAPILEAGIAAVAMNPDRSLPGISILRIANRKASKEMVDYLVSLGHRHIAFIGGTGSLSRSRERLLGYKASLVAAGYQVRPELITDGDFDFDRAYEQARRLLSDHPEITCVFAASDMMALAAITACQDLQLRVPTDVSIAGFDDIDLGTIVRPTLTTVHQPSYEMGALAAKISLSRPKSTTAEVTVMETSIVVRQSTGACRDQASPRPVMKKREPGSPKTNRSKDHVA